MFEEVCRDVSFSYDMLDKDTSYSFIMQHVDNRVVSQYQFNDLILIEAYKISHTETDCVVEFIDIQSRARMFYRVEGAFSLVRFDKENYHDFANVKKNFDIDIDDTKIHKSAILQNVDTIPKGVIVKNLSNGHRMKFRNTTYDYSGRVARKSSEVGVSLHDIAKG